MIDMPLSVLRRLLAGAVMGCALIATTPVKACEYYDQMADGYDYQAEILSEKIAVSHAKGDDAEFCSYMREYILMSEKYNHAIRLLSECRGRFHRGATESAGRLAEMRVLMDKVC